MKVSQLMMFGVLGLSASIHAEDREDWGWEKEKPIDYAASIVADGINVFAITDKAAKKHKGSPFVPNPAPFFEPGVPQLAPAAIVVTPNQKKLFALYLTGIGSAISDTVWSFDLTPHSLEENGSVKLPVGGFGDHAAKATAIGATDHFFFYSTTLDFEPNVFTWNLYDTREERIRSVGEIQVNVARPGGGNPFPSEVIVDEKERFVYICTPAAPQISVYSLEDSKLKFGFTSTDPEFVAAKCGPPPAAN